MFLGRPVNQWIGLITAAASLAQVLIITLVPTVDPVVVATIIGAVTGFLGVLIAFVAVQTPTVNAGSEVNVVTPPGEQNKTVTVA